MVKLIKNKSSYSDADYIWNNWSIKKIGGFITMRIWIAKDNNGKWFWQETLKGIKENLIKAETSFESIPELFKNPLY